jgi:hypothetical protein
VTSPALLAELSKKDLHDLDTKSSKQDKKEERRAKATTGGGSKGGGGRGAREVKTKKVYSSRPYHSETSTSRMYSYTVGLERSCDVNTQTTTQLTQAPILNCN